MEWAVRVCLALIRPGPGLVLGWLVCLEKEEEQRRTRAALEDLQKAVEGVEKSLAENEKLVKGNVRELEDRIDGLGRRVDDMKVVMS